MTRTDNLAVVVAVEHDAGNVAQILANLDPAAHADVDFIFCSPPGLDLLSGAGHQFANVRCIHADAGARIPHMWRDGILAAATTWVGLLSAHCVATRTWMASARALAVDPVDAGIGGFLTNSDDANARDWAVYLLRYVNYSRARAATDCDNIAADNAIYRRSEVVAHADLMARGFWEPEFHKRFFARGFRLRLTPDLEVIHRNRYSAAAFARQRREHGFEFGGARARTLGTWRLILYVLAAPLIPIVLFGKIRAGMRRYGWSAQVPRGTAFWLGYFILNWAAGEARGLVSQLRLRGKPATHP